MEIPVVIITALTFIERLVAISKPFLKTLNLSANIEHAAIMLLAIIVGAGTFLGLSELANEFSWFLPNAHIGIRALFAGFLLASGADGIRLVYQLRSALKNGNPDLNTVILEILKHMGESSAQNPTQNPTLSAAQTINKKSDPRG